MSIRSTIPKIEKRKKDKQAKQLGILNFDEDNLYPQRTENYIQSSGTATACVNLYAKFIRGGGFADQNFYKTRINDRGLTVDGFLRFITREYSKHKGFAVHVQYNILGDRVGVTPLNFTSVRIGDISQIETNGRYKFSNQWDEKKQTDVEIYEPYNPDKNVVFDQIERAGGIEAYKGQILYVTEDYDRYPLSSIDSVLEDVIADSKTKTYRMNITSRSFLSETLIEYPYEFKSEDERNQAKADIEEFQGTENAGKVMMAENPNPEFGIKVHQLAMSNSDKMFQLTNETCKLSIIQSFNQPLALLSTLVPGKLGTSTEISDAFKFYNEFTKDERYMFEEVCKKLFSGWYYPINPSGNYSIIPLEYEPNATNIAQ